MTRKWMCLPIAIAAAGCAPDMPSHTKGVAEPATEMAVPAAPMQAATQDEDRTAMDATVPANFSEYANAPAGNDRRCLAGASTDDDGLNQKPVLYVSGKDQAVQWSQTLPLPPDTYQSRATHCLGTDDLLYVLLQSDTQPEQTLSQTLLRVLKVDSGTGAVLASADVAPVGVTDAHSAWVEEGSANFQLRKDKLVVTGRYFRLAAPEDRKPFQVELDKSLNQ